VAAGFSTLPLSEATLRALKEAFDYESMSDVQARVLPAMLSKTCDFVVRAHTGTGKTITFLIPIVEALLASPHAMGVGALVVAPTRELALQISKAAEALMSFLGLRVVTLIGGNSQRQDHLLIRRKKPRLVVGTPGRLLEHFERTFLFPTLFEHLETLVLDEADRLLSLGFLDDIKEIIAYLPVKRRSMLFSATVPESVLEVVSSTCRGNYEYVDCIGQDAPTASMVEQSYATFPGHECLPALYNLLLREMARDRYGYKILVFFPTARMVAFMAHFFRQQLHIGVYEIHRRRDPAARVATQARFQQDRSGILFSSDVSARGLDYPNVSLVVQFGAPATREMYIHRVGRTARAGKSGRAVLLLGELEQGFLRAVEDLPLVPYEDSDALRRVNELVVRATTSWLSSASLRSAAAAAFASLLVHYKATHRVLHMVDDDVLQASSDLLLGCGLVDQPVVSKRLAVMLGLERHPRLRCAARLGEESQESQEPPARRGPWRG